MFKVTLTAADGRPVLGVKPATITFRQHAERWAEKQNEARIARGSHCRWIVSPA